MADVAVLGLRVDASGSIVATESLSRRLDAVGLSAVKAEKSVAGLVSRFLGFAAATQALVQAVAEARRFSDAMAEVSTLLSDTSGIDNLTASVRELSVAFGKDTAQEAKALYQIISAGAADAAAALTTLTAANKLAVGGVTDVATAADGLTSILNAFGPVVGSATNVSDALFVSMRAGKTTIEQLSQSIGTVAPIAATLGVSLEDVLAATSALTKGGVQTSVAVTGLRAILAAIAKPSEEAAAQARALGVEFNTTALRAKGLQQFLLDLNKATNGNTTAMAQFFGGVESLVPVLGLVGASAQDYVNILASMEQKTGQTEAAFNKIAESPGFKIDKLLASAKDEALGLGLAFLNTLGPALDLITRNMQGLVEAVALVASVFAAKFLGKAIADGVVYVRTLQAQRAATIAAAEAAVASAQAEVAASARRTAAAASAVRVMTALGTTTEALATATARLNVETAIAAQATARLAAAEATAAVTTSSMATAMGAAATTARAMWAAIGGPIGATLIALYAIYKIFLDNSKAIAEMDSALQGARERAQQYATTLGDMSVEALKAAEAQERLNVAALASKLSTQGAAIIDTKSAQGDALANEKFGRAIILGKEAAAAQEVYNATLVQTEEAMARLNAVTTQRTTVERAAQRAAADAALAAAAASKQKSKEYRESATGLALELEKQNALNAAFNKSAREQADITAAYALRAQVSKINAEFTGDEAKALVALATALAASEAEQRKLTEAKQKAAENAKLALEQNEADAKLRKDRAQADKELADALNAQRERRDAGAKSAARDIELLQREINLFGKSAKEARAMSDAYLEADKRAEFLAAGLDAVGAAVAAQEFVKKKNELDALTQGTIDWAEALQGINGALRNLSDALDGDAQKAVKYVSAVTNAVEVLIRAQKAAKAAGDQKQSGSQQAVGAAGAALGGFGAGSAFGSTTSNKTVGTVGGALSGAATGALIGSAGGPLGAVIGGVIGGITGAIGGLIASSKNATQELIAQQAAQKSLTETLAGLRATFSNDALGTAIAQARIQFESLRKQTQEAFSGKKNEAERGRVLAELNVLEARRVQLLQEEFAAQQVAIQTAAEVRVLNAQGRTAEAEAVAQSAANQKELADLVKAGATQQSIAAVQAAQLAEAEQKLRTQREEQRRTLADLTIGTQAFTDPRGAAAAALAEEQARRVFDAIARGASEAEQAAIALYNAAQSANREAEILEADTRQREALVARGQAASGDVRGAEDSAFAARQRQELADAIKEGQSPANLALLRFVQFAERSQQQMLRAIQDGTKAIQQRAKDDIAANNLLIEVIRTDADKQLAKLDEQIEATQASARAVALRFDQQIAAVREQTKAQVDALDAQIASQRGALDAANRQVSLLEDSTRVNIAVVEALQEFSNSSKLGDLSTLSPEQKLAEARAQFEALASAAGAGDANAAQGLPNAANALLQASRAFNASNSGFVTDFNRVQDVVAAVQEQFGKTLPVDLRALEVAQQQVVGINATIEALTQQKDAVQAAGEKQIGALSAAKEQAAADAQKVLEELRKQRETISVDAQAQIDKLTALNDAIELGAQQQIEALQKVEEEAHQARLSQDAYWTTYLAMIDKGLTLGGPRADGPTPIVITAENNPVAAQQLEEQKRANVMLAEKLDKLEERLASVIAVAVAASNDEVAVGNRIVQALGTVAAETRNAAQAAAVRVPVPRR